MFSVVDNITVVKKNLVKKKNDDVAEEPWVQCDTPNCGQWVHQICGLFNGRKNESTEVKYACPACVTKWMMVMLIISFFHFKY